MAPLARTFAQASRARYLRTSLVQQPRRFAHSSYGNEQSGHEQGLNQDNPKRHLEHPGPETPAQKSSDGGSSQGGAQPKVSSKQQASQESSSDASGQSAEVSQHNKEMEQRHDRSANQLSEEDNKVDKKFWQGDVGDMSQNKSDGSRSK